MNRYQSQRYSRFHDSNRDFFDTNRKPISATKWHIDRRNATHAIFGEKRLDIWKNLRRNAEGGGGDPSDLMRCSAWWRDPETSLPTGGLAERILRGHGQKLRNSVVVGVLDDRGR